MVGVVGFVRRRKKNGCEHTNKAGVAIKMVWWCWGGWGRERDIESHGLVDTQNINTHTHTQAWTIGDVLGK